MYLEGALALENLNPPASAMELVPESASDGALELVGVELQSSHCCLNFLTAPAALRKNSM